MNGNLIKHVRTSVVRADAATKAYIDRIQHKTATGVIDQNPDTYHTLFIFDNRKTIKNDQIIIGELFVERILGVGCSIMFPVG